MKNKLLLMSVCILLVCPIVFAEENSYFPEGMKWTSRYIENDGGHCGAPAVCTIMGDTIIEGRKYNALVCASYEKRFVVPIRESDKKIYAYITDRDILFYDFEAGVGDSIPNCHIDPVYSQSGLEFEEYGYAHIIKTDSIMLLNGQKAKRQFFDKGRPEDIEYIGSAEGIFSCWGYPLTPICYGVHFEFCCSINGEPLYEYNPGDCERINTLPINTVQADVFCATKIFQNGQLLIERNDKTYTLTGIETK